MAFPTEADHVDMEDYILILQDGCYRMVSYEEFIRHISLGGVSICQAVLNCWDGMGDFEGDVAPNEAPKFTDIYVQVANRGTHKFTNEEITSHYSDAEGDRMARIVVSGGNLAGVTWRDAPVYVGQAIGASSLNEMKFSAQDADAAYQQYLEVEVYDENNIKAE